MHAQHKLKHSLGMCTLTLSAKRSGYIASAAGVSCVISILQLEPDSVHIHACHLLT